MVYLYENKYPVSDALVIGKIIKIDDLGVTVTLPEYNDIEGHIAYSEVSRKKKFKINNLMEIGKEVLLITLNVNIEDENGDEKNISIDLSKRSIRDDEISIFMDNYKIYLKLFDLWKYIYLKINNIELNNDTILNINVNLLYKFMKNNLWKLITTTEPKILLEMLYNKNQYNILNDIEDCDKIKEILQCYVDKKIIKTIPKISKELIIYSYEMNGLNDIKYVLDYKNFDCYNNVLNKYNIEIKYMTNTKYNLHITLIPNENNDNKENNDNNENNENNINEILNNFVDEIKKRSVVKNVICN